MEEHCVMNLNKGRFKIKLKILENINLHINKKSTKSVNINILKFFLRNISKTLWDNK